MSIKKGTHASFDYFRRYLENGLMLGALESQTLTSWITRFERVQSELIDVNYIDRLTDLPPPRRGKIRQNLFFELSL